MKIVSKIQAGSIQYVIVISLVIMIILFSFISLSFLQKKTDSKLELYHQVIENTYSAFAYLKNNELGYNKVFSKRFSEFNYENTSIVKKRWGIFDLVYVRSQLRNEIANRKALMGNHSKKRKALHLHDNNQPLVLVGNTRIQGDVLLPSKGVKSGNIAGTSYYGNQLIHGNIEFNDKPFPTLNNIDHIERMTLELPFKDVVEIELKKSLNLDHSFYKKPLLLFSAHAIDIDKMTLSKNIIVKSDVEIRIGSNSKLEDIILIAPKIFIEPDFEGSLQAFASKQIVVSENTKLNYPSVLSVLDTSTQASTVTNPNIILNNGVDFRGSIIYHNYEKEGYYNIQVQIQSGASVIGEIYCTKNLELKGKVDGFVIVNNFVTKKLGTSYVNHLYNAEINSDRIEPEYSGLSLGYPQPNVAKWVN